MNQSLHWVFELSSCVYQRLRLLQKCKCFSFSVWGNVATGWRTGNKKIRQYVGEGVRSVEEMEGVIRSFVKNAIISDDNLPPQESRRFFPLSRDIRNYMYTATNKLRLSKIDQENLHMKIMEWKKKLPKDHFFPGASVKAGRKKPQGNISFITKMETR